MKKILILAGGGGHAGYAYALAQKLYGKAELEFFAPDDFSRRKLSRFGKTRHLIKPRGPKTPLYRFLPRLAYAFFQSFAKMITRKYDVVVSTGSNFCIMPAIVAWMKGIPIVNIESCVRFTKVASTVRKLRYLTDLTMLQWEEQKNLIEGTVVGPIYPKPLQDPRDCGYILVTGGTYGFKELFDLVSETGLDNVILQTGKVDPEPYRKKHPRWGVFSLTENFSRVIRDAGVVVTHFGSTILEAVAYRKPLVIVPNPEWFRTAGPEDAEQLTKKLNAVLVLDLTREALLNAIAEAKRRNPPDLPNGAENLASLLLEEDRMYSRGFSPVRKPSKCALN